VRDAGAREAFADSLSTEVPRGSRPRSARVTTILDTGPLVALFNAADRYHGWVREALSRLGVVVIPPGL